MHTNSKSDSYAAAGVDITAGYKAVELMKEHIKTTLTDGKGPATSASLSGDALLLPESLQFKAAYEMAYGKASSFLDQAQARGVANTDGFGMLVGQAIEAFYIWHGVRPELKDFL